MSSRPTNKAKYHHLYTEVDDSKRYCCFYCGAPASTEDHVPPLDYVSSVGTDTIVRFGIKLWLVPSCHECNMLLGCEPIAEPLDRKLFIKKALTKRYKKVLSYRNYSKEELEEFGRSLRDSIKQGLDLKQQILKRIEY